MSDLLGMIRLIALGRQPRKDRDDCLTIVEKAADRVQKAADAAVSAADESQRAAAALEDLVKSMRRDK